MAKRRDTASLIDRFISGSSAQTEPSTSQAEPPQVSEELLDALNKHRHKNVGRPKTATGAPPEERPGYGDTRFTIIVKKELQQKMKYISAIETRTLKDILSEVLGMYVKKWEAANGEILLKTERSHEQE